MLTRIEYHPKADEELDASIGWYLQHGRAAAEGFRATIDKAVDLVTMFPEAGPRYLHGTRRIVMTDYPYLLVYRIRDDLLEVIAVAHTSRRPGYWRDRLD